MRHYAAAVGTPSILVPGPCAFGISTAITGGGKYVPEDIRFQILYKLFFRSDPNSSMDTPSTPAAPPFALTFSHATWTARFEITNGLPGAFNSSTRLLLRTPPELIGRTSHERPGPFAPAPLQSLHRYYEPVRQHTRQQVL
jgi:hypothetical protein